MSNLATLTNTFHGKPGLALGSPIVMTDRKSRAGSSRESTQWSLIGAALTGDGSRRDSALEKLLGHFAPGLRAYLVYQMHVDPQGVDDLLQDFWADKVLLGELLQTAERGRGKFHVYLRASLRNYVLDCWRRRHAVKRLPDRALGLADQVAEALADRTETHLDLDEISHGWNVLVETIDRFREECSDTGRSDLLDVFNSRVLRPAAMGATPVPLDRLARRHNLTKAQISNLLVTAQRRLSHILREVLAQYVSADDLDREVKDLHRQLLAAGAWREVLVRLATTTAEPTMSAMQSDYELEELSNVLQFAETSTADLNDKMMGSLFDELLDLPLNQLEADSHAGHPPIVKKSTLSVRAVLLSPAGSLQQLIHLKDFAKLRASRQQDPLPREVSTCLYYGSIVAAEIHHQQRITALEPSTLIEGLDWLLGQAWLSADIRFLLESGRRGFADVNDSTA